MPFHRSMYGVPISLIPARIACKTRLAPKPNKMSPSGLPGFVPRRVMTASRMPSEKKCAPRHVSGLLRFDKSWFANRPLRIFESITDMLTDVSTLDVAIARAVA